MVEKMRNIRGSEGGFVTVITDLFKDFGRIPHGLLKPKFNAFGFDKKLLFFISGYLYKTKQKLTVGSVFSAFLKMLFGIPQGSILGCILFTIFIGDLYIMNNAIDFVKYVDDTAP